MDPNVERRIRDRAYRIWEEEGQPADRDVDHWLRAAQEIAAEAEDGSALEGGTEAGPAEVGDDAAAAKPRRGRAARGAKPEGAASSAEEEASAADPGAAGDPPGAAEADAASEAPAGAGKAESASRGRRSSK